MRKILVLIPMIVAIVGMFASPVLADWDPGDPDKMHWPQTPKSGGYDVEFVGASLADDWMCEGSGPVSEIHFWISWMGNNIQEISDFQIRIWSDLPADHPNNPYGYSVPDVVLWEHDFTFGEYTIRDMPDDLQNWFDPSQGGFIIEDHWLWQQINITDIIEPFIQEEGMIYWLEVDFYATPFIGWKETDQNWNDDAVWWDGATQEWVELRDPLMPQNSIDLAFVVNGEELGACCYPDPTGSGAWLCLQTDPNTCMNLGGTFYPSGLCVGDIQACCMPDGSCFDMDVFCCINDFSGVPQGPGTSCSAATVACCFNDGSCMDTDPLCCDDLGGWLSGAPACLGDGNSNGTDDACEDADGACCYPNGSCAITDATTCVSQGGSYQGDGTVCGGLMACCFADGVCLDADSICCVNDLGGMPQGTGTACSQQVACCMPDGTCQDLDPLCCDEAGGIVSPYGLIPCQGDNNSDGYDDACVSVFDLKWDQPPDLDPTGMDVSCFYDQQLPPPYLLADDFLCTEPGWIREIHIYGSWFNDVLPFGDPNLVNFTLSIHDDISAAESPTGFSMPGEILWLGQPAFTVRPVAVGIQEGWLEPPFDYMPIADTICWEYTFFLQEGEFMQEGTPEIPDTLWLDVQAQTEPGFYFGWKTSIDHWNDDAVWANLVEDQGIPIPWDWNELIYPDGHPWHPQSIDLAFQIYHEPAELMGACCYPDPTGDPTLKFCIRTSQFDCENNLNGVYEGDGIQCLGTEACCLPDGSCIDADALCCANELSGTPQGQGSACSGVTVACCLSDGSCIDVEAQCCDDMGGTLSPWGAGFCLGDLDGNTIDDACEPPGWQPGDPHKMHFPQLPDEMGWDVYATYPYMCADDWTCGETGWVKDLHFWGSWMHGVEGPILAFRISIWSDVPANPPLEPYSHPGDMMWYREIPFDQVIADPIQGGIEGWYNPPFGTVLPDDHMQYFQYNIYLDDPDWFWQDEGTIYWLNITAILAEPQVHSWGWKSSTEHHMDDAVWGVDDPPFFWTELYEPPQFATSMDLAFVITGESPGILGACCFVDGTCANMTQSACLGILGATYEGDGTACLGDIVTVDGIDDICECHGMCGNVNGDTVIDISDAVYVVNLVFTPGSPFPIPVKACGDVNDDGVVDISDAVYLVNYVFTPGAPPPGTCSPGNPGWNGLDCCPWSP